MLMQTGWPFEALGWDYIDSSSLPSRESPSIIYSALYNKSDHTALTAFPVSSTYGKPWQTVTLWLHLDNTILDFRCPFQLCCTWKQSVTLWCCCYAITQCFIRGGHACFRVSCLSPHSAKVMFFLGAGALHLKGRVVDHSLAVGGVACNWAPLG